MIASTSRSDVGWQRQTIIWLEIDNAFQNQFRQDVELRAASTRIYYHPDMNRLTLAFLIAASACEGKGNKEAPIERPDLQMVSSGNEPRKLLRYHVPKGTSQGLELTIDMTLNAGEMGGTLPTVAMSLLIAAEDVTPDGSMKLHTTVVDAVARDKPESKVSAAALSGPLDAMKGIALTSTLAPNGRLSKSQVDGGKQLAPDVQAQLNALSSSFENVLMSLPNEPVGMGAVWRTSRDITQNGLRLTSVNTYAIIALSDDAITYTLDTDVHGADQQITQGGATVDIKDITGTGGGRGVIHLDRLDFESDLNAEFRSKMAAPGEAQPTAMTMTTTMSVRPTKSAGAGSGSAN